MRARLGAIESDKADIFDFAGVRPGAPLSVAIRMPKPGSGESARSPVFGRVESAARNGLLLSTSSARRPGTWQYRQTWQGHHHHARLGHRGPKSRKMLVMRPLKWNSSHAVFVTEIDDDHKEIFDAVARLRAALPEGVSKGNVNDLTQPLALRIEDHFAHEERLMRAARYGLYSWHKRCHDAARYRVTRLIKRAALGDEQACPALVRYLTKWLHNHTRLPDRMLGAFLRNKRRVGKMVFTASTKAIGGGGTWLNSRGERFDPMSGTGCF